jgi:hypothetical protein
LPFAHFITYLKPLQVTNLWVKDAGMDLGCDIFFSFLVRLQSASLDRSRLEEVDALFNHIEFHQSKMTLFRILNGVQLQTMKTVSVERAANGMEWRRWRL